jgi:hypothetical protein
VEGGKINKLSKAQASAVKNLSEIEGALIPDDWSMVRAAGLQLAAPADNRAQPETKK